MNMQTTVLNYTESTMQELKTTLINLGGDFLPYQTWGTDNMYGFVIGDDNECEDNQVLLSAFLPNTMLQQKPDPEKFLDQVGEHLSQTTSIKTIAIEDEDNTFIEVHGYTPFSPDESVQQFLIDVARPYFQKVSMELDTVL